MSCALDMNDIVIEMATGTITPIDKLTETESAAVLTSIRKVTDQPGDVITDAGVGSYGLQVSDLQAIGVVKKGFEITNEMLECNSTFTGKNGIFSAAEILANNKLQQEMLNDLIIANMANLKAQGIITGDETQEELSGLAALAAKYLPSQIKDLLDAAGGIAAAIAKGLAILGAGFALVAVGIAAYDAVAAMALAAFAAGASLIASIKNADILGKLKGFGETIAGLPELAINTIDSFTLDAEVDKLVGVSRIPSISDAGGAASSAASSFGIPSIDPGDYV